MLLIDPKTIDYQLLAKNVNKIITHQPFDRREGFSFAALMMINGMLLQGKKVGYFSYSFNGALDFKRDLSELLYRQFGNKQSFKNKSYISIGDGLAVIGSVTESNFSRRLDGISLDACFIDVNNPEMPRWVYHDIDTIKHRINRQVQERYQQIYSPRAL